jgi:hypothetical protein
MYDSIAAPEFRSFEFHPNWGPGSAQMGAFKDGCGNFFFAWFSAKGAVIRGFDHDSVMSPFRHDPPVVWPGIFDGLPSALAYAVDEVAFVPEEITFAFWATGREGDWKAGRVKPAPGKDADGAQELLGCFQQSFERWRKAYYDTPRSSALRVLWDNEPLTREVVLALNPEADLKVVREEAKLLGWKTSGLEGRNTSVEAKMAAKKKAQANVKAKAKAKAKANAGKPRVRSFGEAEFLVRCEPTRVRMLIHGKTVVAEAKVNVYDELFDLVKARLVAAKRSGV